MRAAAVTLLLLVVSGTAAAAGPTDIARVDEFIDAPRALFGRTRAELERTLGTPTDVRPGAGAVLLSWPGRPRTAASARPRCRARRPAAAASAPCAAAPRAPHPSPAASGRA